MGGNDRPKDSAAGPPASSLREGAPCAAAQGHAHPAHAAAGHRSVYASGPAGFRFLLPANLEMGAPLNRPPLLWPLSLTPLPMTQLTPFFRALALGTALLVSSPAYAQPDDGDGTTQNDDGMDLGWIGLLGLAGLAGLMRRRDTDRRDIR